MDFDVNNELKKLREQTKIIRKRRYSRSRLDKYAGELLAMYRAGATTAQLQRWLRRHRIKVVHSTVARWLAKHG